MLTTAHSVEPYLEKVLTSVEFSRAKRMARFLRFIVEETLAGRMDELKERQIGIEVFDRSAEWDPKVDNIVRSEARRLRTKLTIYYNTAGKEDLIRISIPKGGYAAEFAEAGGADIGILAYSLANSPELQKKGSFFQVPKGDYPPMLQSFVVIKDAKNSNFFACQAEVERVVRFSFGGKYS